VIKEAFLYQLIPLVQNIWGDILREEIYIGAYSAMTWVAYSFASPALLIMGLYFCGFHETNPKAVRIIKSVIWLPALFLSFVFFPLSFDAYQQSSQIFWYVYSAYNIILSVASVVLMFRGVRIEKSKTVKKHKFMLCVMILPASIYMLITIFVIHPLGLERWFKAWQWNVLIVVISLVAAFVMAFKNGFLGLKLTADNYQWSSDMDLIGKGADYTNHMIKNQTSKMELSIEHLKTLFAKEELPQDFDILSRSISVLKNYTEKIKRHSQIILLYEEPHRLKELLTDAVLISKANEADVLINNAVDENIYLLCDKIHLTEVFSNIITNAVEAIRGKGVIEISGTSGKSSYILRFTDNGIGMNADEINKIFMPYYTTKSTEKNFGLGLSYCKNVIENHGGSISAESTKGKGTAVIIEFPSKRISETGARHG
jgi:hypothetical protein